MQLVRRDDLEKWAGRVDSKSNLPYLISRLVRATTPYGTQADFPSGSATYVGGWDGVTICQAVSPYVPKGTALYEFGTTEDCKGKADDDYDKRKLNPNGYNPSDCVFIFVTPRFWKLKQKWIDARKAENFWKDVKVYDSVDLEQWLDIAHATSIWFAGQVGSYPFDGVMTVEEFWEEWSTGPDSISLVPDVITAGREYEIQQLLNIFQGPAVIKGVKASTKYEAIAFIIAAAKQFPPDETERFFSKSLVIDTEGNFRGIRINTQSPLNLIPRFEDVQNLYVAVAKGHHVLIPLGADDMFNQETITLPTIDRDGQVSGLVNSGVSRELAEKCSKESARNITIVKKLIGFPYTKAKWAVEEDIREILPALLIGRWNEKFKGDIDLLEILSGMSYQEYSKILTKWKNLQESPILQIGETWRLTSPLDLWTNLINHVAKEDFDKLQQAFIETFKSGNPILESEDKTDFVAMHNKQRKYSSWCREGLTQSLILVSRVSEGLKIPSIANGQTWVDNIIAKVLSDASGELWISFNAEMPLLSEASPTAFLKAVSGSLAKDEPEVMHMFIETDGFLHPNSHHTGLLWALEGLAWDPDYLKDAANILLQLDERDPGGKLSNRPMHSLVQIFKPWHYQTLASFDQRMEILKSVTHKTKKSGWNLLMNLLPESHGVAQPTHKMRWRMFDKNTAIKYTHPEAWKTYPVILDMLLSGFEVTEDRLAQMLGAVGNLTSQDKRKVVDWAKAAIPTIGGSFEMTRETLRKTLSHHRSHPDTNWSMHKDDLAMLEELYNQVQPNDPVEQYIWLFEEHWPQFPEGSRDDHDFRLSHERQQERIEKERDKAAKRFLKELGLEKTLTFRETIKEPRTLGDTLARVVQNQNDILKLVDTMKETEKDFLFLQSFMYRKFFMHELEWIKQLVKTLQERQYSKAIIANLLILIPQSRELWNFVSSLDKDIIDGYWKKMEPRFYHIPAEEKVHGIRKLLDYKRFVSAIDMCSHFTREIPSSLMAEVLEKCATEKSEEARQFRAYEIQQIFEHLDKKGDLEPGTIIRLEWLYLSILSSYGSHRPPKAIQNELAKSPAFFIEVLKWVYKPKEGYNVQEEKSDVSPETVENRAKQGFKLLRSWTMIPGMKEDSSIDEAILTDWVDKARELAAAAGRIEIADSHIGQVLAQYPEEIPEWPNEVIFRLIERVNSDSMKRNYSSALFNKRGSSTRGPFDGGDIERGHAAYFKILADKTKNNYPNVSEIFSNMNNGYLADAKRMDEEAERDKLEY